MLNRSEQRHRYMKLPDRNSPKYGEKLQIMMEKYTKKL